MPQFVKICKKKFFEICTIFCKDRHFSLRYLLISRLWWCVEFSGEICSDNWNTLPQCYYSAFITVLHIAYEKNVKVHIVTDIKVKLQLKDRWFYVISYSFGLRRLAKRSKAASKTGQILLKNSNISIATVNWRVLHTEIWNIWEIDCIFQAKPCNDLFIEITLAFHIVYDSWSFQRLYLTPS